MKFEFYHDFIAKQVYDKSSADAKARRKVESIVQRALQRHLENKRILLSKEDLAEIRLYETAINFSPAEQAFIQKSQWFINRRRNFIIWTVTTAFIVLSGLVIWALNEQRNARIEQRHSLATALAAKSYERQIKGDNTSALRFAQYAYQATDRDATRQALFNSFFQRNKFYYHQSVKADSNAIVYAEFITRDTPLLVTTSLNGNIKFWNQELDQVKSAIPVHTLDNIWISPDGALFAFIDHDGALQLMERSTKSLRANIGNQDLIEQITFSPTEALFLSITRKGKVKTWNFDGQPLDSLKSSSTIRSAAFTPDGQHIVALSPSGMQFWTKAGGFIENVPLANPHRMQISPLPFESEPCFLLGCIYDGTQLGFWRACHSDGRIKLNKLADFPQQSRLLMDLDISMDGKLALLVDYDYVALYQLLFPDDQTLDFIPTGQLKGHTGFINQAVFNPSGDRLYTISDDQTIKLWMVSAAARPFEVILDQKSDNMDGQNITRILESPYYALSEDGPLKTNIWNIQDPASPYIILSLEKPDIIVTSTHDGQKLATLFNDNSLDQPTTLQIWDSTGILKSTMKSPLPHVQSMEFLANNKSLLTFQHFDELKIWDLNGNMINSIKLPGNFSDVSPSPVDSNLVAVLSDRMEGKSVVGLYNLVTDSLKLFVSSSELDTGGIVKFSPSGDHILSIHFDKIELWDLEGQLIESIVSYDESFSNAFFAHEEKYLIAIDGEQAIIMDWTQAEKEMAGISQVNQAVFSRDMSHLFMINPLTNTLERWPFTPENIFSQIEKMDIADLSPEEKQRYGIKR